MVKVIVTDIEGTTSSLNFIQNTLLAYVPQALPRFLKEFRDRQDVQAALHKLDSKQAISQLPTADLITALLAWMQKGGVRQQSDLYEIQFLVLEYGYLNREFKSHIYEDVYRFLSLCSKKDIAISIFSSAPVVGQQLFFKNTLFGDISPIFTHYFDTVIGDKVSKDTYQKIALNLGVLSEHVLYLSDSLEELDAAKMAGCQTCLVERDEKSMIKSHSVISSFEQITDIFVLSDES